MIDHRSQFRAYNIEIRFVPSIYLGIEIGELVSDCKFGVKLNLLAQTFFRYQRVEKVTVLINNKLTMQQRTEWYCIHILIRFFSA